MRKAYVQPLAELIELNSFTDFLFESEEDNPLTPPDNEMGGSTGDITPGGDGGFIW